MSTAAGEEGSRTGVADGVLPDPPHHMWMSQPRACVRSPGAILL